MKETLYHLHVIKIKIMIPKFYQQQQQQQKTNEIQENIENHLIQKKKPKFDQSSIIFNN